MNRVCFNEHRILGLIIFFYRKKCGLSQMKLAEAVGISRTHMSRIETNDCSVSLEVIFAIAKALNIPAMKLFEFRD